MMVRGSIENFFRASKNSIFVVIMLVMSLSPLANNFEIFIDDTQKIDYTDSEDNVWVDGSQPWPQFGRTSTRLADVPDHSTEGGAGLGMPKDAETLLSITEPSINWEFGSYSIGTDALGTPIADFRNSIEVDGVAEERCGNNSLFSIIIQTEDIQGGERSFLKIVEGEDADLAWRVDLGETEKIKATPSVVDINLDGKPEIIVVYDASGNLYIDAWSPRLYCSVTGWQVSGHSMELLWTLSDEELRISSDDGPYTAAVLGNHKPTTQPLLADLDLDGDAELVIAAINEITEEPTIFAIPLQINGTPNKLWEISLDKGSHPSDPAFVQTDENTGFIFLTTIEIENGAMWLWKIESSTGDSNWEGGFPLNNLDGGTNSPHIRLPGPIIANLDSDTDSEIIVTIPSDADGSSSADGAEFRALEIDNGSEIWSFEASNGFADAPPSVIDTDFDGEHDRVCWVTWWQNTFQTSRTGVTGCHDVGSGNPDEIWSREIDGSSGTLNDEIAVSSPTWMEIDGEEGPELLVAFGRSLWAFDGEFGTTAGINEAWSQEIELSHRTWSSPSLADMDGDATLDLVIGSMVISVSRPDVRPLMDGKGIEFNPSSPNAGEEVTVNVFIENAGTAGTEENTEVVLMANGEEIARRMVANLEPVGPSGNGVFSSFSAEWSGGLGEHNFKLILDPFGNITQTRIDNDIMFKKLIIVPTFNASFEMSTDPTRVNPGDDEIVNFNIRSTGRLAGQWSLEVDDSSLPSDWTWIDRTPGGIENIAIGVGELWNPSIQIFAPESALGTDSGFLGLTLVLDEDENISISYNLPVEANRTRGLSIRGPDGTASSTGYGLVGGQARAWIIVENLGNAEENPISLSWDSTDWGPELTLHDSFGDEINSPVLGPGESKEMTVRIVIPDNQEVGSEVTTPLSMCVGMGEERQCSEITINFVSTGIIMLPSHQRSVPSTGLNWEIVADMPLSSSNLSWSISEAGMAIPGWTWESSGAVALEGDTLKIIGESGERVNGTLSLNLPNNAPPAFHSFSETTSQNIGFSLSFSIEILQIHRAGLEITYPEIQPFLLDVRESEVAILRLENNGNGLDSYDLSYEIITDENLTEDPGIEIYFSSNPISLSAGSLQTVPLNIIMPENTPARIPIRVLFIMTSAGNSSISDSKEIIFEVTQDHRWEISEDLNDKKFIILPNVETNFSISAKNIGNIEDDLTIVTEIELDKVNGDSSVGWASNGSSKNGIKVNQTMNFTVMTFVPEGAWNASKMNVKLTALARGEEVWNSSFTVEVGRLSGWKVMSNNANLEISENGSIVELRLHQKGNAPSIPFVSSYIVGDNGWLIGDIGDLAEVNPGDSIPLFLNITPSIDAIHGKSVDLFVRVREGNSAALIEISLPLRVEEIQKFDINNDNGNEWPISDEGGFSYISIENQGNSPTTIEFEIIGLKEGWEILGASEMVLGVSEIRGLPIEIIPPNDWDGSDVEFTVIARDFVGNVKQLEVVSRTSNYSWGTHPIITGMIGDEVAINIHGATSETIVLDSQNGILEWSERGWILPIIGNLSGILTIDGDVEMKYFIWGYDIPSRVVFCQIKGDLGNIEANCNFLNGSMDFEFGAYLIGDDGSIIDSEFGVVPRNTTMQINLSSEGWNPEPGNKALTLRVLDSKGREILVNTKTIEIRNTDWNVGLVSLELEGLGENQKIKVLTKRNNENILSDADCEISLKAGEHSSVYSIDMTSVYVPTPKIDRPNVEDGIEAIIRIDCRFPWDIDSNPNDNEYRIVLSGGSIDNSENENIIVIIISTSTVCLLYFISSRIKRSNSERRRLKEMTKLAIERRLDDNKDEKQDLLENSSLENEIENDENIELKEIINQPPDEISEEDEFDIRLRKLLDRK